jgi:hypothetical protein
LRRPNRTPPEALAFRHRAWREYGDQVYFIFVIGRGVHHFWLQGFVQVGDCVVLELVMDIETEEEQVTAIPVRETFIVVVQV